MANLFHADKEKILELQPLFALALNDEGNLQASYEIKTRSKTRRGRTSRRHQQEPISIFLTLRQYGPIQQIDQLIDTFDQLTQHAENLATERLVPHLLTPIFRQITSNNT